MLHVGEMALASLAGVLAYFIAVNDPAFPLTTGQKRYVLTLFLALLVVAALASLVKQSFEHSAVSAAPDPEQPSEELDQSCRCSRSRGVRGPHLAGAAVLMASVVAWRMGSRR